MTQIVISIPDMQSAHCQVRVSNVVKAIDGAQIHQVNAGLLTVSFASAQVKEEIFRSIENEGYTVERSRS